MFLHPTTRGGQIRSLQILRQLHRRHEIHYLALDWDEGREAMDRAVEYSTRAWAIAHPRPGRGSPRFAMQLAGNLVSPLPLAVSRFTSHAMRRKAEELIAAERYDRVVCDFLHAAQNTPGLDRAMLFQHNVETTIWERHAGSAPDPLRRWYFQRQAERMRRHEGEMCRLAGGVVAVSEIDAARMREMFAVSRVSTIPTGVEIGQFARPPAVERKADFVFVGSMDWLAGQDGAAWFVREIFPLVRAARPEATFAIVGRNPSGEVLALGREPGVTVTGTVPDVRPWLFGAAVSVVPLRIGGGTRLKIYEAMAARVPVVSTTVGAEGLAVTHGENILMADSPRDFAAACVRLLHEAGERERLAEAAWRLVASQFSSEAVAACFERILEEAPAFMEPAGSAPVRSIA